MYILHRASGAAAYLTDSKHTVRNTAARAQKSPALRCPRQDKHLGIVVIPAITEYNSTLFCNIYALLYIYICEYKNVLRIFDCLVLMHDKRWNLFFPMRHCMQHRVTRRPLFPGHVLLFRPKKVSGGEFQNRPGFWSTASKHITELTVHCDYIATPFHYSIPGFFVWQRNR
jgi:hypothetical protein